MPGILALDLATCTGWCVVNLDATPTPQPLDIAAGAVVKQPLSGSEDFRRFNQGNKATGRYYGRAYHRFRGWLDDMLKVHNPDYIVFEAAISFHKSQQAARMLLYLVGCVEEVGYANKMDNRKCFEVNVQHVKKHATGRGNVKKDEMIKAGRARGWTFADDNECDALWLADYALSILGRRNS